MHGYLLHPCPLMLALEMRTRVEKRREMEMRGGVIVSRVPLCCTHPHRIVIVIVIISYRRFLSTYLAYLSLFVCFSLLFSVQLSLFSAHSVRGPFLFSFFCALSPSLSLSFSFTSSLLSPSTTLLHLTSPHLASPPTPPTFSFLPLPFIQFHSSFHSIGSFFFPRGSVAIPNISSPFCLPSFLPFYHPLLSLSCLLEIQ